MPIPIITNFSVNTPYPIDTRIISTSSTSMENMLFKYEGLITYRTDINLSYTWNGSSWFISSNGIYGGSGRLGNSNTVVEFGTVSTPQDSVSSYLNFKGYSRADGASYLNLSNYFYRNDADDNGTPSTLSYKSQLRFFDSDEQTDLPGPYIIMNPPNPVFSSRRYGGISFGTMNPNDSNSVNERLRIEGMGLVRFKLNSTTTDSTKSLNIGVDSSDSKVFIGYNWDGGTTEFQSPDQASYIQFENNKVGIFHAAGSTSTHSVIFSEGSLSVNGTVNITNGNIETNKSIRFGADDTLVHYVSYNGNGIKYDSGKKIASLSFKNASFVNIDVLAWNSSDIYVQRRMSFTQSASLTTYGPLRAKYEASIWDNDFNPDRVDSTWSIIDGESARQTLTANTVLVTTESTSSNQFTSFKLSIRALYTTTTAKATYLLSLKSYDRYLYIYNDSYTWGISHQVELWLANKELYDIDPNSSWVKVGHLTNGNKPNYNDSTGNSNVNYQIKTYSHSILVPANMYFKIVFKFPYAFSALDQAASFVRTAIIRSGNWLAPTSTRSLDQVEIDLTDSGA